MRTSQKLQFGRGIARLGCILVASVLLTFGGPARAEEPEPPPLPTVPGIGREPLPITVCPQPCTLNAALAGDDFAVLYVDYTVDYQTDGYTKIAVYAPTPEGPYAWSIAQTIQVELQGAELMTGNESALFVNGSVYRKYRGSWIERQVLAPEGTLVDIATWGPLVTYLTHTDRGSEVFVYREGRFGFFHLEARLHVGEGNAASLAVGFGRIVVGAPEENAGVGAAHVFVRGARGWRRSQKLTPSATDAADFGRAVAVNAQWLAVGAPDSVVSPASRSFGEVYLYRRDRGFQWIEAQRMQDPYLLEQNSMWSRRYGNNLALHGPWLLTSVRGTGFLSEEGPQVYLARAAKGAWTTVAGNPYSYIYNVDGLQMTQDHAVVLTAPKRGDGDAGLYSLTDLKRDIVLP